MSNPLQSATASGTGATALTLGTAAAAALGMPRGLWIAIGVLAILLAIWTMVLWMGQPRKPGGPTAGGEHRPVVTVRSEQAADGGSVVTAGRDINIGVSEPPAVATQGQSRTEQLRRISDEIRHIERRLGQLDQTRKEWGSIWPGDHAPYQPLPAEQWNLYGAALHLPQPDHDVVQETYELANDFNHHMERGPTAFGDPEPDLEGLRTAFEEATRIIAAAGTTAPARTPSEPDDPFVRARQLQRKWENRELGAALLSIRQELVVNERRLKRMLALGSSRDFKGFASAQWTRHEDRVRRDAAGVCVLADQAYGLIVELREARIEDDGRKLTDDEMELGQEAINLFERTIAAIDCSDR